MKDYYSVGNGKFETLVNRIAKFCGEKYFVRKETYDDGVRISINDGPDSIVDGFSAYCFEHAAEHLVHRWFIKGEDWWCGSDEQLQCLENGIFLRSYSLDELEMKLTLTGV